MSYDKIMLGHGSGGRMMRELIEKHFIPVFGSGYGLGSEDSAVIPAPEGTRARPHY